MHKNVRSRVSKVKIQRYLVLKQIFQRVLQIMKHHDTYVCYRMVYKLELMLSKFKQQQRPVPFKVYKTYTEKMRDCS